MKPVVSGHEDSYRRENLVLNSLFSSLRSKSIVVTSLLADRAISSMETNFSAAEVVGNYARFSARSGWILRTGSLPGTYEQEGETRVFRPDVETVRRMVFGDG